MAVVCEGIYSYDRLQLDLNSHLQPLPCAFCNQLHAVHSITATQHGRLSRVLLLSYQTIPDSFNHIIVYNATGSP